MAVIKIKDQSGSWVGVPTIKGDTGPMPSVSIGSVITLPAGSGAMVMLDPASTDDHPILNFALPRGADGSGTGDMLKTAYDTNGDGKVNGADTADSVPWSGVANKPTAYTPSAHTHALSDVTGAAPLASPALTGTPSAPTATAGTSTTQLATTAFVANALSGFNAGGTWGSITGTLANQTDLQTALNGKQAAVTGAASTVTGSNLAVNRVLVSDGSGKIGVSSVLDGELAYLSGLSGNVQTLLNLKAPLASPALTGTPTAPTATAGTNTTQIATTAFVAAALPVIVNGSATYNSTSGRAVTHNLGTTGYSVSVTTNTATGSSYIGEVYVVKAANTMTVYNTGTSTTATFDYIIIK